MRNLGLSILMRPGGAIWMEKEMPDENDLASLLENIKKIDEE